MASANIYNLKHVDYAERGQQVEIIVDGVPKRQTIIFSGADYFGEKYYFTEQGLRYIQDSRLKRRWQNVMPNYLAKIPIILKSPQLVVRNIEQPELYLFCDKVAIKEHGNKKCLLRAVLIRANINVVWNFYWLQENRPPIETEIFIRAKATRNVNGDYYDVPT